MAQRVVVELIDDLDGGKADESVAFTLDGVSYQIDLSAGNAETFRDAFVTYTGHARRVGGRARARVPRQAQANGSSGSGIDTGAVRAWARQNDYVVSDRGRISGDVVKAYEAAQRAS